METINGTSQYRESSQKEVNELQARENNILEGLKKESIDLLMRAENKIDFDHYTVFTVENQNYLYCKLNETCGVMHEEYFKLFNTEIIRSNFFHNNIWDKYKEIE